MENVLATFVTSPYVRKFIKLQKSYRLKSVLYVYIEDFYCRVDLCLLIITIV